MKQREKKSPSIKTRIILIVTVFAVMVLILFVAVQMLFLDVYYEKIKMNSVNTAATEIAQAFGSEKILDYMSYWHTKEQLDILVVDNDGKVLLREMSDATQNSKFNRDALKRVYQETKDNGGIYEIRDSVLLKKPDNNGKPPSKPEFKPEEKPKFSRNTSHSIVVARLVQSENLDTECMVLVYATLSPVRATVHTLWLQLIIAVFLLFSLSVLIGHLVARKLARPIIELNKAAKGLAKGCYQSPSLKSYREVEELKATLEETSKELQRADALQRELVANVSHDLRTPLTMITGYSEAIRDFPTEDSAENIQVVIDEAKRLTHLVNDVLDLAKLRSGTQQLNKVCLNLTQVVRDMAERYNLISESFGYAVRFEGEENVVGYADEIRLSQAVYNLIGNAVAHAGEDKTAFVKLEKIDRSVRVSVTDHGCGIPADELEDIWKRYYRTRQSDASVPSGTGLGLSIVSAVVEMHGGRCGVESEPGKGSCFWFELPLLDE